MTILDVLKKAGAAVADVEGALDKIAAASPDLAPQVAVIRTALDAAVSADNLAALGAAIPGELLQVAQGKLTPTPHAGDAA